VKSSQMHFFFQMHSSSHVQYSTVSFDWCIIRGTTKTECSEPLFVYLSLCLFLMLFFYYSGLQWVVKWHLSWALRGGIPPSTSTTSTTCGRGIESGEQLTVSAADRER
jgi:hypothetical protein